MEEQVFQLNSKFDFIALNQLLKALGWVENGAMANTVIAEGMVTLNDNLELRKRAKIRENDVVSFNGEAVKVIK